MGARTIRRWPILACVCLAAAGPAVGSELRLRRAVLTLGGVGTFEYEAPADPQGIVTLDVRRGDVDDVLKSLTVLGSGVRVDGLDLAGPDGSAAAFAALPFGPESLGDPLALLGALRGVPVEVRDPSGREIVLSGRVMGAARDREPAPGAKDGLERTRVTLLTDAGLRQFVLEEAGAVRVADPALQGRLDAALAAMRGQAAGDRRQIRLRVGGADSGPVRVSVVIATPLWKPTYRLALPRDGETQARLQGWAVLENLTASDWSDVALSLQTGNPVAFRQNLFAPTFVDRPEVAVDQQTRLAPRRDEAAAPLAAMAAAPAPAMREAMPMLKGGPMPAPMASLGATAAVTEGIAATMFELPSPVSLAAGATASLPFLDVEAPAESLGLLEFQHAHPLAAVRLTNATAGGWPGGAVATFDQGSFAGDALLPPLPAGERRVLTFAEDQAVTANWTQDATQDVTGLTAAGGVAHLVRTQRTVTSVDLTGAATASRKLLLAAPRIDGATLSVSGGTLSEQTATSWRVLVTLKPGEQRKVVLTADRLEREDVALTDDPDAVLRLLDIGSLSAAAREAIEHIVNLRRDETARNAERDRLAARREEIVGNEARLRDNLAAVPVGDPLHTRLLRQLDQSETDLQALEAETARARKAAEQARDALAAAIAALSIRG
jgi:hypothetical protein